MPPKLVFHDENYCMTAPSTCFLTVSAVFFSLLQIISRWILNGKRDFLVSSQMLQMTSFHSSFATQLRWILCMISVHTKWTIYLVLILDFRQGLLSCCIVLFHATVKYSHWGFFPLDVRKLANCGHAQRRMDHSGSSSFILTVEWKDKWWSTDNRS